MYAQGDDTQGSLGVHAVIKQGLAVWAESETGTGVYGSGGGSNPGVSGASNSGNGVLGTSGSGFGVYGKTTTGLYGVRGDAGTASGSAGIFGSGNAASGIGVQGTTTGDVSTFGVKGTAASGIGVSGDSTSGVGVYGTTTALYGVRGDAGSAPGSAGVLGYSNQAGGVAFGTVVAAPATTAGFFGGRVVVNGDFAVTGTKNAAVKDAAGNYRLMYCVESPESWFEDFGKGQMTAGKADVRLEPEFAALIHSDDYGVFLTAEGDSKGLYVTNKSATGFSVREQQGGASSLAFRWRVVAKRADVKGERLAKFEMPHVQLPEGVILPTTPTSPTSPRPAPLPSPAPTLAPSPGQTSVPVPTSPLPAPAPPPRP